jgi:hypothetical protein
MIWEQDKPKNINKIYLKSGNKQTKEHKQNTAKIWEEVNQRA